MGNEDNLIGIISNAADPTADFLQHKLAAAGVRFVRLNTEDLAKAAVTISYPQGQCCSSVRLSSGAFSVSALKAIYYRRPKPPDIDESVGEELRSWMQNEFRQTWGGMLLALRDVNWMNHPLAISEAAYKPEQLARALEYGLHIPDTLITSEPSAAEQFCLEHEWQVVAKPVGHGEIRGADGETRYWAYTNLITADCWRSFHLVENCPTLFQRYIRKVLDIRATVIGDKCISVALHSQENEESRIDCRRQGMRYMRYSKVELPDPVARSLVALARSYGLQFAAVDLALDGAGQYWFLELNPAGQWAWLEEVSGVPISSAIIDCLCDSL